MVPASKRKKLDSPKNAAFEYIDECTLSEISKACILESVGQLTALIEAGGPTNCQDNQGRTPLHLAAERGNVECCRLLLNNEETDINAVTHKAVTPLMNAAASNCMELVQLLVSYDAKAGMVDGEGLSCLDRAVDNDNAEIFMFLLSQVDPNKVQSFEGWTIAHTCAKDGHFYFLKLLVDDQRCRFEATEYGITPLHLASQEGHVKCVELLVEWKKDLIEYKAVDGVTPIFVAAQNGHIDVLRYLITNHANVNVITENGTVLHSAVIGGNYECLDLLLRNGADVEGAIGKTEVETPLCQAVFNSDLTSVNILLKFGADPLCCSSDQYSSSALHLCFENMLIAGEEMCEILKALVKHIDVDNATNAVAEELIPILKESDNLEFLKRLLNLLQWNASQLVTHSVLSEIISSSRIKCLAYLLSCNYSFPDIVISDSILKYFINSTAGLELKHLIHQALFDQYKIIPRSFYSILCNNLLLLTSNPPKYNLLNLINKNSYAPRSLVDLCRFKVRDIISCRDDFSKLVDSLPLNEYCKEILLLERYSTVSPSNLKMFSAPSLGLEGEIERNYMVM